jgi:hypothetical protein
MVNNVEYIMSHHWIDKWWITMKWINESFKETSTTEFLMYLKPNLQKIIRHNFVVCWQYTQCILAMLDPPKNIISIYFVENYIAFKLKMNPFTAMALMLSYDISPHCI